MAVSCGVGHRCGSDLVLLWHRPAAAAPTGPLAWEPACATGVALKRPKKKKMMCEKCVCVRDRGTVWRWASFALLSPSVCQHHSSLQGHGLLPLRGWAETPFKCQKAITRQNHNSKRYMHPYVQCSTSHNSQDMETTQVPISRRLV